MCRPWVRQIDANCMACGSEIARQQTAARDIHGRRLTHSNVSCSRSRSAPTPTPTATAAPCVVCVVWVTEVHFLAIACRRGRQDSTRKKHAIYFNLNFCFAITENATCMRVVHWSNNSAASTHAPLDMVCHISSYSWVHTYTYISYIYIYFHVLTVYLFMACSGLSVSPVWAHLMSLKSNNNIVCMYVCVCAHNLTIK